MGHPSPALLAGAAAGGLAVGYGLCALVPPVAAAQTLRDGRERAVASLRGARGLHPALESLFQLLERFAGCLGQQRTAKSVCAAAGDRAARPGLASGESSFAGNGGGDTDGGGDLSPSCSLAAAGTGGGSGLLLPPAGSVSAASVTGESEAGGRSGGGEKLRMVVVVRDDVLPRWGQGKTASMVATVLLGLYKRCYKSRELRPVLMNWEAQKGAKSVLRVPGEAALSGLVDAARGAGVAAHTMLELVPPAAASEPPSRTRAILALGPATPAALSAVGCQGLPTL